MGEHLHGTIHLHGIVHAEAEHCSWPSTVHGQALFMPRPRGRGRALFMPRPKGRGRALFMLFMPRPSTIHGRALFMPKPRERGRALFMPRPSTVHGRALFMPRPSTVHAEAEGKRPSIIHAEAEGKRPSTVHAKVEHCSCRGRGEEAERKLASCRGERKGGAAEWELGNFRRSLGAAAGRTLKPKAEEKTAWEEREKVADSGRPSWTYRDRGGKVDSLRPSPDAVIAAHEAHWPHHSFCLRLI